MEYYLGIDLGGTNIAIGLVNSNYEIVAKASTPTKLPRSDIEIYDDIVLLCKKILNDQKMSFDHITWAGIGAPGTANQETGILEYSNNLKFHQSPMREYLSQALNIPVYIENDANAAAYGEFLAGSGKGTNSMVAITLGTGVGGGIIIDGKIYAGANYAGAELGHTVIVKDGRPCTCGRKGCFEAYSSATGLIQMTKEAMERQPDSLMWEISREHGKVSGRTAFDAMRKGDIAAKEVVEEYISYLACGLTNMVNIFQPDVLCIGGGICNEGETLLAPLREQIEKERYSKYCQKQTALVTATLGNDAGIIGAAMLGKNTKN